MFHALTWIYELYALLAAVYFGYEWAALGWSERKSAAAGVASCICKTILTAAAAGLLVYLFWIR